MVHGLRAVRARDLALVGVISAITFTLGARSIFSGVSGPPCLMAPPQVQIPIPQNGITWLKGKEPTGKCEAVPAGKWVRKASGAQDLFVYADGPSGSLRYWTITVGIAKAGSPKPARGFCLEASTLGWRTLQQFKLSPLPWLDDVDGDGKAEFILWDSFPLRADASMSELGLTAWVYRLTSDGTLVIDWDLTRKLVREIAAAYRAPLKTPPPNPSPLRAEAATALEMFADARCTVPTQNNR